MRPSNYTRWIIATECQENWNRDAEELREKDYEEAKHIKIIKNRGDKTFHMLLSSTERAVCSLRLSTFFILSCVFDLESATNVDTTPVMSQRYHHQQSIPRSCLHLSTSPYGSNISGGWRRSNTQDVKPSVSDKGCVGAGVIFVHNYSEIYSLSPVR